MPVLLSTGGCTAAGLEGYFVNIAFVSILYIYEFMVTQKTYYSVIWLLSFILFISCKKDDLKQDPTPPLEQEEIYHDDLVKIKGKIDQSIVVGRENLHLTASFYEAPVKADGTFEVSFPSGSFGLFSVFDNNDSLIGMAYYSTALAEELIINATTTAQALVYCTPGIVSESLEDFNQYRTIMSKHTSFAPLESYLKSSYSSPGFTISLADQTLKTKVLDLFVEILKTSPSGGRIAGSEQGMEEKYSFTINPQGRKDAVEIKEPKLEGDTLSFFIENYGRRHIDAYIGYTTTEGTRHAPEFKTMIASASSYLTYLNKDLVLNDVKATLTPAKWPDGKPFKISVKDKKEIKIETWGMSASPNFMISADEYSKYVEATLPTIVYDYWFPILDLALGVKETKKKELRGRPANDPLGKIFSTCIDEVRSNLTNNYREVSSGKLFLGMFGTFIGCAMGEPRHIGDYVKKRFPDWGRKRVEKLLHPARIGLFFLSLTETAYAMVQTSGLSVLVEPKTVFTIAIQNKPAAGQVDLTRYFPVYLTYKGDTDTLYAWFMGFDDPEKKFSWEDGVLLDFNAKSSDWFSGARPGEKGLRILITGTEEITWGVPKYPYKGAVDKAYSFDDKGINADFLATSKGQILLWGGVNYATDGTFQIEGIRNDSLIGNFKIYAGKDRVIESTFRCHLNDW